MTEEEIVLAALEKAKDSSKKLSSGKEFGFHPLYKESVDAMMSISYHAKRGIFPEPLFKNSSPNVEDKELKYIKDNFKQTTLPVYVDYIATITRPFGDGNWSIEYREVEDEYTQNEKTFQKYVEEELPISMYKTGLKLVNVFIAPCNTINSKPSTSIFMKSTLWKLKLSIVLSGILPAFDVWQ